MPAIPSPRHSLPFAVRVLIVAAIGFAHVRVGALVAAAAAADVTAPARAARASGDAEAGAPLARRPGTAAPAKTRAASPTHTRVAHPVKPGNAALAKAPAKPKAPAHDPQAARILDVAAVGDVTVYAAKVPARGFALFASGDGGWNLGVWDMAHAATELGYWVAGFSTPAFLKALENGDGDCSDGAALLDTIAAKVRRELALPDAWRPTLIGYSSGATVVYAALAQAGDARFAGAMTLGFCPDLIVHKPFCTGAGLTAQTQTKAPYGVVFDPVPAVPAPWVVLQGEIDQVCHAPATQAFVAGVRNGSLVMLPKVGHGYSVPRNWLPQYRRGLVDLLGDADANRAAPQPAAKP